MPKSPSAEAIFESAAARIESEYQRLGHTLGWSFLSSPQRTFSSATKTALITLNPGGSRAATKYGAPSCEQGSAYRVQSWRGNAPGGAPLQVQIQDLFRRLGEELDETLSAYFIPFRSPTLAKLHAAAESRAFATALWRDIFKIIRPTLVICIDRYTYDEVRKQSGREVTTQEIRVGWGPQTASIAHHDDRVVLRFPHLSRFKIFGRPESEAAIAEVLSLATKTRRSLRAVP